MLVRFLSSAMTVTSTTPTATREARPSLPTGPELGAGEHRSGSAGKQVLLTIKDVASACQLSESAVRHAIYDGELQAVKLRSRLRIERAAFDAWIGSQRQPPIRVAARPHTRPQAAGLTPTRSFRALVHTSADRMPPT
jgi:excisionase family DNA binding protein